MGTGKLPFNVTILQPTKQRLQSLRPVTALDHYDGMTQNFHPDGLFSTVIFGRVGDPLRDKRFSYIDIKVPIFHPVMFKKLRQLRALYTNIIMGKAYAKWSPELSDFEPATEVDGQTGFTFFIQHWKEIKFKHNRSSARSLRIAAIEKFRDVALTDKVIVIPAGLRDLHVEDGRTSEDEINSLYRRLLIVANTIAPSEINNTSSMMDVPRASLQTTFNTIYETLETMITPKKGFLQGKWGSRRIFDGTRNVIVAMNTVVDQLGSPRTITPNHCQLGLYQTARGALPLTMYLLKNSCIAGAFNGGDNKAVLVDKKTLKPTYVDVSNDILDKWTSKEGLEKLIDGLENVSKRNLPIEISGHYLALVYFDDKEFRVFNNIDDLPADKDRTKVHPITLFSLVYLSGYRRFYELVSTITRYPIAGAGSIFPTSVYVSTTISASAKWELGPDWQRLGDDYIAREFPDFSLEAEFFDSMAMHPSREPGATADHDGDTCSANILYTPASIKEVHDYFKKRQAYITPGGKYLSEPCIDTVSFVLRNMTGE